MFCEKLTEEQIRRVMNVISDERRTDDSENPYL